MRNRCNFEKVSATTITSNTYSAEGRLLSYSIRSLWCEKFSFCGLFWCGAHSGRCFSFDWGYLSFCLSQLCWKLKLLCCMCQIKKALKCQCSQFINLPCLHLENACSVIFSMYLLYSVFSPSCLCIFGNEYVQDRCKAVAYHIERYGFCKVLIESDLWPQWLCCVYTSAYITSCHTPANREKRNGHKVNRMEWCSDIPGLYKYNLWTS